MQQLSEISKLEAVKLKKNIGERIKFFRKKRGLSQQELAELVDIEMKSLSRIESGHNYPQCENLVAIAKVLNVLPWQLYFYDEPHDLEKMKNDIIFTVNKNESTIPKIYQYVQSIIN